MQEEQRQERTALITGITGQDGSYLAELLLDKGYRVHGVIRRSSSFNTGRIDHLYTDPHEPDARLALHYGDLLDASGLRRIVSMCRPDEVYNLGAQSHVRTSFDQPVYTCETIAIGTLNMLEAIRDYRDATGCDVRLYQAGSSEMFGNSPPPQNEDTPFRPRSPYACAKVHAFFQSVNYREAYGMFVCNGILFNHESPRRGETFVTRKITRAAARIKLGMQDKLYLGNLDAKRDWGHARDYVRAMWLMLQRDMADDYVIATGESHTVADFLQSVSVLVGVPPSLQSHVVIDERYKRPTEVDELRGDAFYANIHLGWIPQVGLLDLVREMVEHDMDLAEREKRANGD